MKCPSLSELPAPPKGRTGWPWTENAVPESDESMAAAYPVISIITPSYQQGRYLEETIRSVLLQGYPELEFIIIDGGSTDESVDIIKKYEPWIASWCSERDRGQSDAINKGFALATGSLGNWLNSDDVLTPGALFKLGAVHTAYPESIICGDVVNFWDDGSGREQYIRQENVTFEDTLCYWRSKSIWHQPGMYYPVELFKEQGGAETGLYFCMDYNLFCRMLQHTDARYTETPIVRFRYHAVSKSFGQDGMAWAEKIKVYKRYVHLLPAGVSRREFKKPFCIGCVRRSFKCFRSKRFRDALALLNAAMRESTSYTIQEIGRRAMRRMGKLLRISGGC